MAKTKKILYLVTQSEWGGAQKYIFDLATNLVADFEIMVAAGLPRAESRGEGNGELFKSLEHENIRTVKLKRLKRTINPFFDFLALLEIIKLIKQEQPNIIHLNSSKISILGSLASKWVIGLRSSVIYTAHGWVFNEPLPFWQRWLYLILEKYTARLKDKIICVSDYDKQVALKNKICSEHKLITIHNGIDYDNLKFLDKDLARQKLLTILNSQPAIHATGYTLQATGYRLQATGYRIIGTIANLYKTKGLGYLIDSAKQVIKNHPNAIFMVIGDGPERKNLTEQIKKANLENNFLLLGNINQAHKYLKAFDIFILPSVKEGFPYTILEALAAKLPIIAAQAGGVPEIINDGINGLLVEPKNSQKLAHAIERLLADESLRQRFTQHQIGAGFTSNINLSSTKLVRDLSDFSLQKMIDKTKGLY